LAVFLLVVALIGFADSTYLTIEHFKGTIPPCSIVEGCDTVLTSEYSVVAGVPVALLGSIFYFLVLVGVFSYIESKKTTLLKWALLLTVFGLICTVWFTYLQAFVIKAFCLYCLGSALTSAVLFVTAVIVFKKYLVSEKF